MSVENRFNAVSPDNSARIREYSLLKTAILLHKSRENTDSRLVISSSSAPRLFIIHKNAPCNNFSRFLQTHKLSTFFFHKSVCASTRQHKLVPLIENFQLLFWLHSRLDRIITAAMSHKFDAAANYFLIRGGPIPLSAEEFYWLFQNRHVEVSC